MKKQIIIAVAFLLGINNTQAQDVPSVSTNVNIILTDVISIDDGSIANNGIVAFEYNTAADYNSDKNVTVENSLIITSSRNFDVKVKAEGDNFVSGTRAIPVNVIKVKAVTGGTMVGTFNEITLTSLDKVLVGNATLGARKSLSIDYSISKDKAQTVLLGNPAGTYTQTITYTATAI